jgi:hypothetical protein
MLRARMSVLPPTSSHPASRAVFAEPPPAPTSSHDVGAPPRLGLHKGECVPIAASPAAPCSNFPHARVRRARKTAAAVVHVALRRNCCPVESHRGAEPVRRSRRERRLLLHGCAYTIAEPRI